MRAVYNTPHEAFPLLCSWQLCSNCQILTASKPKRTVTPLCIYVCPTSAHRGFRYGHRRYKINSFILKATSFGRQSITSKLDLTLLNSDMSKKHTFACFFWLTRHFEWHDSRAVHIVIVWNIFRFLIHMHCASLLLSCCLSLLPWLLRYDYHPITTVIKNYASHTKVKSMVRAKRASKCSMLGKNDVLA